MVGGPSGRPARSKNATFEILRGASEGLFGVMILDYFRQSYNLWWSISVILKGILDKILLILKEKALF